MGEALKVQNRTIFYSLCEWGTDEVWTWGNETAQSWRMSNDIDCESKIGWLEEQNADDDFLQPTGRLSPEFSTSTLSCRTTVILADTMIRIFWKLGMGI